jgi:hypothetical protein
MLASAFSALSAVEVPRQARVDKTDAFAYTNNAI